MAILRPDITNLVAPAIQLPSYAATNATLAGKPQTGAEIAATERFAVSDYILGLAGMSGRPAAGDPFLARITSLVGLPEDVVRRERGRVSKEVFARELRKPQGEILSLYDGTITRGTLNPWTTMPVIGPRSGGRAFAGVRYLRPEAPAIAPISHRCCRAKCPAMGLGRGT